MCGILIRTASIDLIIVIVRDQKCKQQYSCFIPLRTEYGFRLYIVIHKILFVFLHNARFNVLGVHPSLTHINSLKHDQIKLIRLSDNN